MNIIELAEEVGLGRERWTTDEQLHAFLARFAALVRAKREWVDLTDDEIFKLGKEKKFPDTDPVYFASAVIAAFKEKNK